MTKDPNTGYFAVKDSDGTLSCYDPNLNKVNITYKDVAEYFDESCSSLKYIGQNGHEKTMTKDPNTGYFAVKDSDGTLTCYDANLKKIDIADTSFNEDGTVKQ